MSKVYEVRISRIGHHGRVIGTGFHFVMADSDIEAEVIVMKDHSDIVVLGSRVFEEQIDIEEQINRSPYDR